MNSKSTAINYDQSIPQFYKIAISYLEKAIKVGSLTIETAYGDFTVNGNEQGVHGHIEIKNWKFFLNTLLKGDIGLAESFRYNHFDSKNLTNLFLLALENEEGFRNLKDGNSVGTVFYKLKRYLFDQNSKKGSKKNIHSHYDLGNSFFSEWLDPSMTYSSAFYNGSFKQSLENAQIAKYERIIDLLDLKKGSQILEIGCGWGGFAEVAAKKGYKVTGITISKEQYEYAKMRIKNGNLQHNVSLYLKDYRDIEGQFDAVVSIEMIEAVGMNFWTSYFSKISQSLKEGGKAIIQGITINDNDFNSYKNGTDFIQQFIFPGGMLINESQIQPYINRSGMELTNCFYFGKDYAETLKQWEIKFDEKKKVLEKMGYDKEFQKIWNFYLSYCQAGFLTEKTNVVHAVLRK